MKQDQENRITGDEGRGTGDDALLSTIADMDAGFTAYQAAEETGYEGRGNGDDALLSTIADMDAGFTAYLAAEDEGRGTTR